MAYSDEEEFLKFLRSDRDVGIFKDRMPTKEIPLLLTLPKQGTLGWSRLWLWDRDHSPVPELKYVEKQKYFMVAPDRSEVIELLRSSLDGDRLIRGRIWAEMDYWLPHNPPALIKKGIEFSRWYNRLASWIKRHSFRDDYGDYIFPGAAEFQKEGGKLLHAVFAKKVKLVHHQIDETVSDHEV